MSPYSSVDEIRAPFTFAPYATLQPLFSMTLAFVLHEAYEKAQTIMLSYGIAVWALCENKVSMIITCSLCRWP